MLQEQEEWPANKADISAKIEDGYAAAQRGELIDGDRARTEMEEKKRAWRIGVAARPRD